MASSPALGRRPPIGEVDNQLNLASPGYHLGATGSPRTRHDLLRGYRSPPGAALVQAASPIGRQAAIDSFRDMTARETLTGTLSPRARARLESISTQERAAWHLAAQRYQAGLNSDSSISSSLRPGAVSPSRVPAPTTPPLEDAPAAPRAAPSHIVTPPAAPPKAVTIRSVNVEEDPRVVAWMQYKRVLTMILEDMTGDVTVRRARATAAFHTLAAAIPGGVTAEETAAHERMLALMGGSAPAAHTRGASAFNTSSPVRKTARLGAASPTRGGGSPSFVTSVATALLKGQHPVFSPPRRTRKAGMKRAASPTATVQAGFLRARTLHAFQGIRENKEVTFSMGEEVLVFNSEHDGWWYGEVGAGGSRRRGWFPRSYVIVDSAPTEVMAVAGGGGGSYLEREDEYDEEADAPPAQPLRGQSRGRSRSPTAAGMGMASAPALHTADRAASRAARERSRDALARNGHKSHGMGPAGYNVDDDDAAMEHRYGYDAGGDGHGTAYGMAGSPRMRLAGSPGVVGSSSAGEIPAPSYMPASHTAERAAVRAARERARYASADAANKQPADDSDGDVAGSAEGADGVYGGGARAQGAAPSSGSGRGRERSRSPGAGRAQSPLVPVSHTADRAAVRAVREWGRDGTGHPSHGDGELPETADAVLSSAMRGLVHAQGSTAAEDIVAAAAQYQELALQMRRPGTTPTRPGARSPVRSRSNTATEHDDAVQHVLQAARPGGTAYTLLGPYDHAPDGTSAPTAPMRLRSDPQHDTGVKLGDNAWGTGGPSGFGTGTGRGHGHSGGGGVDGVGSASEQTFLVHDDITDDDATESTFYDAAGGVTSPVRLTYDSGTTGLKSALRTSNSGGRGNAAHGTTSAGYGSSGGSGGRRAQGNGDNAGFAAGYDGVSSTSGTDMGMFKELAAITGAWDGGSDGDVDAIDDGIVGPGSGRLALARAASPSRVGGAAAMPSDARGGRGGKYDTAVAVARSRSTSPTDAQPVGRARSPVRSGKSRSPVQFADEAVGGGEGGAAGGGDDAAAAAYSNALASEGVIDSARSRSGTLQRQLSFDFSMLAPGTASSGDGGGSSSGSAADSEEGGDEAAVMHDRIALASAVSRIASDPVVLANLSAQTGIPIAELAVTAVRHAVAASKAVNAASSRSHSGSRIGSVAHSMGATLQADQDELAAFDHSVGGGGQGSRGSVAGSGSVSASGASLAPGAAAPAPFGAIQVPGGLFYPVTGAPGGGFFVPAGAAAAAVAEAAAAAAAASGLPASAVTGSGAGGGEGGGAAPVPANFTVVQGVDGRRVKVLAMDGRELWELFRPRMRAFAIVVGFLRAAMRRRMAIKVFMLGMCLRAVRERRMARYRAKIFCVGLARSLYRRRRFERVCVKVLAVGLIHGLDRVIKRNRAQSLANALAGMGGPARAAVKKAEPIDPNAPKTKAIHWDALSRVEGTIWDRKGDDSPRDGDVDVDTLMPELISKFTVAAGPPAGASASADAAAAAAAKAVQVISLLDPKTARNVGIALSNIVGKRALADVRAALLAMDEVALGGGLDRVQLLAGLEIYTDDKTDPVKAYDGDASKLDMPSRFIKEVVLTTANLPTRLSVMEFKLQLPELLAACHERIDTINAACDEISNSTRFATLLLDVILPLGNKLNTLSRKGAAAGFKISSLNKLVQTKSSSGETFLRFIVDGLMEKSPQVLAVADDFPTLQRAKGPLVSMPMISTDLAKLEKGSRHVESLLTKARATKDAELMARLAPLHEQSRSQITELKAASTECTTGFEELCRWLGEDPGKTTTEDLFATIQTFLLAITKEAKAAQDRAEKQRKAEAKQRKEEEARAAKIAPQLHKSMRRLSRAMNRADAAVLAAAQVAAAEEAAAEDASPTAGGDGDTASSSSRNSKWDVVRKSNLAARAVAAALNVSKNARRASIMMRMSDGSDTASMASPTSGRPLSSRSGGILEAATGLDTPVTAVMQSTSPTLAPPRAPGSRRMSVFDVRQLELAAAAAAADEEPEAAGMAPPSPAMQRTRSPSGASERPRSMRGAPALAAVTEMEDDDDAGFAAARARSSASRSRTPSNAAAPTLFPAPPPRTAPAAASPSPSPATLAGGARRPVSSRNLRLGVDTGGITAEQVTSTILPPRTPKAPMPASAMQLRAGAAPPRGVPPPAQPGRISCPRPRLHSHQHRAARRVSCFHRLRLQRPQGRARLQLQRHPQRARRHLPVQLQLVHRHREVLHCSICFRLRGRQRRGSFQVEECDFGVVAVALSEMSSTATATTFWGTDGAAWDRIAHESAERYAAARSTDASIPGIPKIIHHVWIGGDMPPKLRRLRETWISQLTDDWTHILWSDDCLTECSWYNAAAIATAANRGQQCDVIRLELLRGVGGLYVDADMLLLPARSPTLHALLNAHDAVVGVSNCAVFELNNAVMGFRPGHPLLSAMMQSVKRACEKQDDGLDRHDAMATISRTGPGMVTRTVMSALAAGTDVIDPGDVTDMQCGAASILEYARAHAVGTGVGVGYELVERLEPARVLIAPKDVFYPVRNDVALEPPTAAAADATADNLIVCGLDCSAVKPYLTPHSIAVHYWARTWQRKAAQLN